MASDLHSRSGTSATRRPTIAVGSGGVLFLVVAAVSLLSGIEDALNDVWGVRTRRSYVRRLTTYWTVVSIATTLLLLGVSMRAAMQHFGPLQWFLRATGTGHVFFSIVLPVALVCAAFTVLYLFMVDTPVPIPAALVGGSVGGLLWSAAAWTYSWYVRTTVYYTSIYDSLSAIPIFIFWLYVSWLIILIGAVVGFAWQHRQTSRQELHAPDASPRSFELLALFRIVVEVSRVFLGGEPRARSTGSPSGSACPRGS